jgi:hypothetical protein
MRKRKLGNGGLEVSALGLDRWPTACGGLRPKIAKASVRTPKQIIMLRWDIQTYADVSSIPGS